MDKTKLIEKLKNYSENYQKKLKHGEPLQFLVYSDKYGIDFDYSSSVKNQPFHIASIGKMLTATIIGILIDKKIIELDELVSKYFSDQELDGLFIYEGIDHKDQVTIRHLLTHTSGIADYFESKVNADSPFVEQIMRNPDKKWVPNMLVDFARTKQSAVGPIGQYFYSDTGYVLIGLLIEKATSKSFSQVLDEYIFRPLEMNDSYLMFYGKPVNDTVDIAPIYFNGNEVSKLNLLSCDWAGGGIISTTRDLLRFQKAFWSGQIVSEQYIKIMSEINNKFRSGMHYGMGMMELRYEEFFFLLRGLPRPLGHSGILSTHMYYDKDDDVHLILNMGSNKLMVKSFQLLIAAQQLVRQYLKLNEPRL
ncbi:beta-lactamase family protein [Candidatus Saccharibacteria bacterium]|nr:beta-lactamase family protein [Candidatus Saccharibacteria bacterium]